MYNWCRSLLYVGSLLYFGIVLPSDSCHNKLAVYLLLAWENSPIKYNFNYFSSQLPKYKSQPIRSCQFNIDNFTPAQRTIFYSSYPNFIKILKTNAWKVRRSKFIVSSFNARATNNCFVWSRPHLDRFSPNAFAIE